MQQSGSSSTNVDASYDRGNVYPALMHKPPYMDVQTVKTNLTVDQAAKLEVGTLCSYCKVICRNTYRPRVQIYAILSAITSNVRSSICPITPSTSCASDALVSGSHRKS